MPKGPHVHEIFHHPASGKKASLQVEKKESRIPSPLSHKSSIAPLPPMKKFGGYKPKILGGDDNFLPVSSNKGLAPEPPVDNRRVTPEPNRRLARSPNRRQAPEPPIDNRRLAREPPIDNRRLAREPSKRLAPEPPVDNRRLSEESPRRKKSPAPSPFIIGDKNTPMVLSTVGDSDSDSDDIDNRMSEIHIYEEPPMYFDSRDNNAEINNNNNNINNKSSNYNGEINNNKFVDNEDLLDRNPSRSPIINNEAFAISKENENLINKNHIEDSDPATFATENPVFSNMDTAVTDTDESQTENKTEPEGVFIPSPDYEENEKSMDFAEEDPDDAAIENKREQLKQQIQQKQNGSVLKTYEEGEDFSKYLSDDEEDHNRDNRRNNHSKTIPMRLDRKHSLFKTNPNPVKRKTSKKAKASRFNSVRNFSLLDSKYGTSGKAGGKSIIMGDFGGSKPKGDFESFLSTREQGEGYESFLNSKHGVSTRSLPSEVIQNGKRGGVFKKLTVRIKHKIRNNNHHNNYAYEIDEQF